MSVIFYKYAKKLIEVLLNSNYLVTDKSVSLGINSKGDVGKKLSKIT